MRHRGVLLLRPVWLDRELRIDFPAHFAEERLHRGGHIGALKEQLSSFLFLSVP